MAHGPCDCFLFAGILTQAFSASQTQSKLFHRVPSPTMGPTRLSAGWTDRSLISCMASCMVQYLFDCHSVLYNSITNLCTPGHFLAGSEPVPRAEEGDLYSASPCDGSWGFELHTYKTVRVCLWNVTAAEVNYTVATSWCKSVNSSLYTVKTLDKLALIQRLLADQPKLWVGLDDRQVNGTFVWQDDGTEIDPNLIPLVFAPHQPSHDVYQDCVVISSSTNNLLNDRECQHNLGFFCEQEPYF